MGIAPRTAGGGLSNSKLALANAQTGEVLAGKGFYAGDKSLKKGTMENRGAWSTTINPSGSVTIPKGYHNGAGRVIANPASVKVATATIDGSGQYSGGRTFQAAGTVIMAGITHGDNASYLNVTWSGSTIRVLEYANSGSRSFTITYAYYT